MSCDVGKVAEALKNELWCRWSDVRIGEWDGAAAPTPQLILQPFRRFTHATAHSTALPLLHLCHRHFTYVTAHSPTLLMLHLHHSSLYNPYAASPTSQVILQPFRCFTYATGTSRTSPGEPPMPLWWRLIYPWWFCNLQWLRPAGLYERCKLALELKRLKAPSLNFTYYALIILTIKFYGSYYLS